MSVHIQSVDQTLTLVGHSLGQTALLEVSKNMVNDFAKLTGDEQWIHIAPERASKSPFGACVAHGNLTLFLVGGRFIHERVKSSARSGVNCGLDRVKFSAPVRATVEVDDEQRLACVADSIQRYRF